jgi:Phospholipase/lecithinase/hemolysin
LPRARSRPAKARRFPPGYNDALYKGLAAQGLRVIPLDTFNLLREITANASLYGFRNVTGTACQPQITAQSLTCNPGSYVSPDAATAYAFADGVHPSTAAHRILADYATATIEGPARSRCCPSPWRWSAARAPT